MAIGVVDEGVHIVATDSVSDEVYIISGSGILSYHHYVGNVIVIPIVVAVEPESRPEPRTGRKWIPVESVAVHHVMMARVHEVGCRVHRTVRRGHVTTRVARVGISTCGSWGYTMRTSTTNGVACGIVATTSITAYTAASATSTIAHGFVIVATDLGGNTTSTRLAAAAT